MLVEAAKSFGRLYTIILEMPRGRGGRELAMRSIQLLHQEVFCFTEIEEFLNSSTIMLGEFAAVLAIQDLCLLERGDLLV
ncbi:hypothetical protein D3C81_1959630 [compost metagenome]